LNGSATSCSAGIFDERNSPDFHNTIDEMFGEGDRALSRLTYRGTHRGELFGIAATGKRIEYVGTAIFRFQANRIREVWVLGDVYGLQQLSSGKASETDHEE
jgi:predicted ester cyclase